jgi:hypothetical protein
MPFGSGINPDFKTNCAGATVPLDQDLDSSSEHQSERQCSLFSAQRSTFQNRLKWHRAGHGKTLNP